jgi:hypothetical protein
MTSTESVGATAWGKTLAPLYVSFNDQMPMNDTHATMDRKAKASK